MDLEIIWKPRHVVYEGEGEGEGGDSGQSSGESSSGGDSGSSSGTGNSSGSSNDDKKFTQEQVDKIVQKRVRKVNAEVETLRGQLENANISATEREELETQLDKTQNLLKTEKQIAKENQEKLKKKHDKELSDSQAKAKYWEDLYTSEKIETDLMTASVEADAFRATQVVGLLERDSFVEEELDDDNKPTGRRITKVKFRETKDGKTTELTLSPKEAVDRMKEDNPNLFKGKGSAGLGLSSAGKGKGGKSGPPSDPAEYRKWRKENSL